MTTLKPVIVFAFAALIAVSCGGSNETAADMAPTTTPDPPATEVVKPTATAEPRTPEPTATPEPTVVPTLVPSPTVEPTATAEPTAPAEPTPSAVPTATPTGEPTATSEAAGDDVAATPPPGDVTTTATDGASVFIGTCAFCHGASGGGTSQGPPLTGIGQFFTADASPLARLVTNGGTNMPEFGSKLTAEQIVAVADYVAATFQ